MVQPMAKEPAKKATTKKKVAAAKKSRKPVQKKEQRDQCFVMMPFTDPFNLYYEQLYMSAITEAGLMPVRADDLFRPGIIVSDLWNAIQKAKVLLAELTTKNANVFYELGLAHAIGKPVVLLSETMTDVPFDLQQLRVLMYKKDDPAWGEKLSADITAAIKETLVEPVEAVPNIFRKIVESQAPEQGALESRMDSLEVQMRRFHIEGRRLRGRQLEVLSGPKAELEDVTETYEFEKWVLRWSRRGMSNSQLQAITYDNTEIPPNEAERIPKIVENG